MSKFTRFFLFLLTAIILSTTLSVPLSAAVKPETDIVTPLWTNASDAKVTLTKSSGKVVITIRVYGYSGTTFSSGEIALFKTSGSDTGLIKSWDRKMSSTSTFTFTDNSTTATSGSYKATFSIKALRNGVGETISGTATLTV